MPTLTIVPLATPCCITLAAQKAIESAPRLFLQTEQHPCARPVTGSGREYTSMDDLYEATEDFDSFNEAVAKRLMCGTDAVYAVLGRGSGQAQLAAILIAAKNSSVTVRTLPSPGWAEAALASLDCPAVYRSLHICPANALPERIDPYISLAVEEMDSAISAGEVKLQLMRRFPEAHGVVLFSMDETGEYSYKRIPLYEIDRQKSYGADTVMYVPAAEFSSLTGFDMYGLVDVMRRLRAPGGCPWDAEQTHETLRSTLIEETYEVLDAIDRCDESSLCEELGDLLLQIVFHAQIEEERSQFDIDDVATGIVQKLVYRHPHVFGTTEVSGSDDVLYNWEQLKKKEKHMDTQSEMMRAVPQGFPALMRSTKVQKKAAHVGFDWDSPIAALDKVYEEAAEVKEALLSGDSEHIAEEIGDLLFSAVNVSRLAKCDAELVLRSATDKFLERFERMERAILSDGRSLSEMTLAQMDVFWEKAKK